MTLNGEQIQIATLLRKTSGSSDWEKSWLDFLAEWYNGQNFIEVQTSGSTGTPKTIHLAKAFVAASARRTINYFNLKPNDRILHCLPSQYIAGQLMIVRALLGQLDLHVVDPSTDFSFLQKESFRFAAMVPNQVGKLLEFVRQPADWNPDFAGTPFGRLEFLLIGGSSIPQTLTEKLQTVATACYSSYAMTETATHIALRKINGADASGFYRCLDDIEVELSTAGCLRITMPGLENPLQTNDLAELRDKKTFQILGRADNVIISGGIKFSPEQLEKKLEPYIKQPFMISWLPHETLGQQLILIVEGIQSENTNQQLLSIFQHQLDKFERPREIRFVPQLPRTPNGKIDRTSVHQD
jgi:O-succinylbenzoic acid--CoA ligase